jgi:hypothetical protein
LGPIRRPISRQLKIGSGNRATAGIAILFSFYADRGEVFFYVCVFLFSLFFVFFHRA